MESHLTLASTTLTMLSDNQERAADALDHPLVDDRVGRAQRAQTRPRLSLASAPAWKHKLILTGRLDHRTVGELEDEIECLCEEGVTVLTLDLRQLDALDSVGAGAIACGGAACRKRGRDFAVVAGSLAIHRALAEAGAEGLLAGDAGEMGHLALAANDPGGSPRDTSTVMVKSL